MSAINDLITRLAKERDELAAEVDQLRCMNPNPGNQRYWEGRYRDEKADNDRLTAEIDQALAQAAAAAIDMRDRAVSACQNPQRKRGSFWRKDGAPSKNDKCEHDRWIYEDCEECSIAEMLNLEPQPDAQKVLDHMLAKAWVEGWHARNKRERLENPYRKETPQ